MSLFIKKYLQVIFPLCLTFFLYILPVTIYAKENVSSSKPSITVINPIRGKQLGLEKVNLLLSLKHQWSITKDTGINATWLWQYSALEEKDLVDFAKSQMTNQEFGLFLEFDRNAAHKAHVLYRGRGPWYFSDGLLLISYDVQERRTLIDASFAKFKEVFGYYPKTVGAWWIGADSLSYMQKKYGILAALRAADQFDLDVYSIWGTPWSIPYLPSKTNALIPAVSFEQSIPVVMLQWAARDPVKAYGNTSFHSTYSIQDYLLKQYDINYFKYLGNIYLQGPLDNIVIGLEGGVGGYEGLYKSHLEEVQKWKREGRVEIRIVRDYAQDFLKRRVIFPTTYYFLSNEYQGNNQAFWFHSPYYRIGIQKIGDEISIVDFRNYSGMGSEDFSLLPNSQGYLRVNSHPAYIDSARITEQKKILTNSHDILSIKKNRDSIVLFNNKTPLASFTQKSVELLSIGETFRFTSILSSISVYWILLFTLIIYFFIVFWQIKNFKKTLLLTMPLLFILFISKQFLSEGYLQTTAFLFDKKQLIFSFLLSAIPVSMPLRILIIFQMLPFFIVLFFQYLLLIRGKSRFMTTVYYIIAGSILLLFINIPYFPLDQSTYRYVVSSFILISFVLFIGSGIVFYISKSKKVFFISLIMIPIILSVCGIIVLVSRQEFVITPFEMEALKVAEQQNKKILYLLPVEKPIYKAIRPLIYDEIHIAERLTNTSWETIRRTGKKELQLTHNSQALLFLPRYVGADISPDEIKKYNLYKIFDNAQIAIFEMR